MLRAVLIATSLVLASSSFAQQVRVISGDIEHVYGPGGELLDDANLQARNQRAREQMEAAKQLAIQRRQQEAAIAPGMAQNLGGVAPNWDSTDGGSWDGGGFIGPTRGFFHRGVVFRPRIGIAHRVGGSPRMGRR
jgi:hypothetical protein